LGERVLLTSFLGDWLFVSPEEWRQLASGAVGEGHPLYARVAEAGFLRSRLDVDQASRRFWRKKSFLAAGPTLHAFVLTARCNHGCQYCHSSVVGMQRTETDMTQEVASRAIDFALSTTSPWLNIEFQGGEPTANWPIVEYVLRTARERNAQIGKTLSFSLVTNFSLLTEEKLDFLVRQRVQVCTSLDGPADLHNQIRIFDGGSSHQITVDWLRRVNEKYDELGLDRTLYRVEALPTVTRASLSRARDIVDEYVRVGCRAVFLRKLDPFGFAERTRRKLGYTIAEFLEFYREAFEYIVQLNVEGTEVLERNAAIMLCKILGDWEPNYLDLRSPGGAAIGQLGYHPDGGIYSSDEGRMVGAMGDDMFRLGSVLTDSYTDVMQSPQVRALVMASTNDAHPDCASCVYQPWCGLQPEYNYKTQGSIFGRMRDSDWCRKHKGIFDIVMRKLDSATPDELAVFRRWTISRRQDHFLHPPPVEVS
jgi:His-Xaa-Ser system radical SAM maturase HxsB